MISAFVLLKITLFLSLTFPTSLRINSVQPRLEILHISILIVMAQLSASDIQYELEHLHESRVHVLLVSQLICFVLAVIAVILRLVSRRLIKAPIQSDDYMILIA